MNIGLPTNHVIVLLDDTGVITGFAGVNYGQAIAYLRRRRRWEQQRQSGIQSCNGSRGGSLLLARQ